MKKTLILGATTNQTRYAFRAAESLSNHGIEFVPVGIKTGVVFGKEIERNKNVLYDDIDTVTLYIGERHQQEWYDYILATKPKRIIFNPGTENRDLKELAIQNNIEPIEACTLVMLSLGNY